MILSDATVVVPFPEIGRSQVDIQMAKCRGQLDVRLLPGDSRHRDRSSSQQWAWLTVSAEWVGCTVRADNV